MARELVSQAEYARRRGVSKQAVNQRTEPRGGPIPLHGPKKQIDPDEADELWHATMHPRQAAASRARIPEDEPPEGVPPDALAAVDQILADDPETRNAGKSKAGGGQAARAKIASAIIRAQIEQINLEKLNGGLIDKRVALKQAFGFSRHMRDAWLNWPASVAPVLAAELGSDPHQTLIALERLVREHLNEISDKQLDL